MAETPQVEEVQQTTFDVMSEAFDELHKDDPIVEETPVEASEEVVAVSYTHLRAHET